MASDTSGSDYEPDQDELEAEMEDWYETGRFQQASRTGGRGRRPSTRSTPQPDESDEEEDYAGRSTAAEDSGYTTGGYTTDDDDFTSGNMFSGDLDPLALLQDMEDAGGPGEREGGAGRLQPFQVLRRQRRAAAIAARAAGQDDESEEGAEGEGDEEEADEEGAEPGPSQGRRAVAGAGSGGGGGAFGADYDDIVEDLSRDPLAAELGLTDRPRGRARRAAARRRRRQAKKKGRGKEVSEETTNKLAEANLLYAMGKYTEAAEILMNVIKVAPNLADPYHTLGLLHEALGNPRKALDFHMISAHLTPKDVERWKRLATLSIEVGYLRQAIYCLSKAVTFSPGKADADARWDRAVLHAELGEYKKAIRQVEEVAQLRPGDPEVPKMLARLHHSQGQPAKAISVLERHLERHPEATDMTHVNILAELYMQTGDFEGTHALITKTAEALQSQQAAGGAAAEEELPMDLVAKNGLCLAHLGRSTEAEAALASLRAAGPETFPDLYTDVGMALAAMGQFAQARVYLEALLELPEFNSDPTLWSRLLLCHRALGNMEAAVQLYQRRLSLLTQSDPQYSETAITLCELWAEAGQKDKASQLLKALHDQHELAVAQARAGAQAPGTSAAGPSDTTDKPTPLTPQLLMRKNKLHLQLGQQQDFISAVLPMVKDALATLESDSAAMANPALPPHIIRAIQRRRMRERKGLPPSQQTQADDGSLFKGRTLKTQDRRSESVRQADEEAEAVLTALSAGEESDGAELLLDRGGRQSSALRAMFSEDEGLNMFSALCRSLTASGRAAEAQELASQAMQLCGSHSKWFAKAKRDVLALLCADLTAESGDVREALRTVRAVVQRWPYSCQAWSSVAALGHHPGICNTRGWSSIVTANRKRCPNSVPAMIMQGHVHLQSQQYQEALGEYFQAYRFWSSEPLVLLCIGVAYIAHSIHRRCEDRNKAILRGFAFLQMYEQQRGNLHESSYNIGRAAHQLGLLQLAQHCYERALAAAPAHRQVATGQHTVPDDNAAMDVDTDAPTAEPAATDAAAGNLCKEAAHNLAQIYQHSGATELARELYLKYLTVV